MISAVIDIEEEAAIGFEQFRHHSVNYLPAGNILRVFESRPDESRRVNIRPSTRLELFKFIQSQVSSLNL